MKAVRNHVEISPVGSGPDPRVDNLMLHSFLRRALGVDADLAFDTVAFGPDKAMEIHNASLEDVVAMFRRTEPKLDAAMVKYEQGKTAEISNDTLNQEKTMRRVTAIQLNEAYAAFLVNPGPSGFWKTTTDYIAYVSYSVPASLRADFVQDVSLEIFKCLSRLQEGSDYAKWVNSIIRNMRADAFKAAYREQAVITTAVDLPEDHLEPDVPVSEQAVRHQLDTMAATLTPANAVTFDLLRQGKTLTEIARIQELPYITIWQRFRRMKAKFMGDPIPEPV